MKLLNLNKFHLHFSLTKRLMTIALLVVLVISLAGLGYLATFIIVRPLSSSVVSAKEQKVDTTTFTAVQQAIERAGLNASGALSNVPSPM